jgi:hypothetical protein
MTTVADVVAQVRSRGNVGGSATAAEHQSVLELHRGSIRRTG